MVKEPLPGGDNDRFAKIFERLAKLPAGHKPRCLASIIFPFVVPHLRIKLPGNCCLIQSQTIEGNDGGRINIIPSLFLGVWLSP